ncbi:hypothetical protein J2Z22_001596 [Paenibacillus forsythiae]|uniref:Uncharacterized protein n=1 Tax=Paenibacillus forsythiae TaxID=365616 RepID=A0ABU3H6J9_9BACL|nr:hypothetical protein [Paenibacillus forsythiae]
MEMRMKARNSRARKPVFRLVQFLTGIHRVYHDRWSYGWKLPFTQLGYFPMRIFGRRHGLKRMKGHGLDYHDCTVTGVY